MNHLPVSTPSRQSGSFLLEALIAILIVALGILGSVGLLARSMQDVDDAKNRGEAAYLANALIGQMWVTDRVTANLDTNFGSTLGTGAGYIAFKTLVDQRLPHANGALAPTVVVLPGPIVAPNPLTNSVVTVTIFWQPPGERTAAPPPPHHYAVTAVIGANQ